MGTMPQNWDDVIDSREVVEALVDYDITEDGWVEMLRLAEQGETAFDDWYHGVTLVRDSYFVEYAQELAEDCGMMRDRDVWPFTCIDWEQAARELQYDYTPVEFGGVTYWGR